MSQDKLEACVCGYPSAQGVHHRSNGPCFVEPVAAQEPICECNLTQLLQYKITEQAAEIERLNRENNELGARISKEINIEITDLRARCEKAESRLEYVTTNIDTVAAEQCYETQDEFYAAIDAAIAKERT